MEFSIGQEFSTGIWRAQIYGVFHSWPPLGTGCLLHPDPTNLLFLIPQGSDSHWEFWAALLGSSKLPKIHPNSPIPSLIPYLVLSSIKDWFPCGTGFGIQGSLLQDVWDCSHSSKTQFQAEPFLNWGLTGKNTHLNPRLKYSSVSNIDIPGNS